MILKCITDYYNAFHKFSVTAQTLISGTAEKVNALSTAKHCCLQS